MPHDFQGPAFDDGSPAGRIPQLPQASRQLINLPASPSFFLKWHPARWYMANGRLLPCLGKLVIEPGINGVDARGGHTIAKAEADRRGWTIIPWEVIPDGYVRAYDVRGGVAHMTRWERPKAIGNRAIIKTDEKGYHAFLQHLLDEGIVPPPDPDIVDAMSDVQRSRISRNLKRAKTDDGAAARLEADRARLAELEAAQARAGAGDE